MKGRVVSVNVSNRKAVRKKPVGEALVKTVFGIEGDAHASSKWHRQVSPIGKIFHNNCEIYNKAGDCIMPKEGIFVEVLTGGRVREGDEIAVRIL